MNGFLSLLVNTAYAQGYQPLAPLPGIAAGQAVPPLSQYLNIVFSLGISVAAGLAVLMIVIGGIQYMSTDAVGGKEDAKGRITSALWGLLLALCSYLILYTINPDLLNTSLTSMGTIGASGVAPSTQTSNIVPVTQPTTSNQTTSSQDSNTPSPTTDNSTASTQNTQTSNGGSVGPLASDPSLDPTYGTAPPTALNFTPDQISAYNSAMMKVYYNQDLTPQEATVINQYNAYMSTHK